MTDNSVFNLVMLSGIFANNAWLMFFHTHFFLSIVNQTLVLSDVWIQVYLICFYAFYCYYLLVL